MTDLELLREVVSNTEFELRSYSGRGMYGKECAGITFSDPFNVAVDLMQLANRYNAVDQMADILRDTRQDNMGRDYIFYWPSVEWSED